MSLVDPEDRKLATLARATRLRAKAAEGAAIRDTDGRTYAAATVNLPSLQISAVQAAVAMAVAAGVRELREETGYAPARLVPLGSIEPNPAIQDNRCHTFLALGCALAGPTHLDEKEDIQVLEEPLAAVPRLLADGVIGHALVAVAFQRLWLWRDGLLPAPWPQ